jgi:hypothetical protein
MILNARNIVFLINILLFSFTANAQNIWVAVNGSDNNNGTKQKPLATVAQALRKARDLRRLGDTSIQSGIHIYIKGGTYFLNEPLFVRPEDAGTKESPTIIEAAENEQPIISGGVKISGWKKLTTIVNGLPANAVGKVWITNVENNNNKTFGFRQLWVNGIKAVRAKSELGEQMSRIISWNHKTQECWIPTPATPSLQNVEGMEMFIHQWWAIAMLRIRKIEVHGDSSKLGFYQPESRIQSEHPWPAPWISKETGNSAFYLTNAVQFLNEPGEWYLDVAAQKLYYYPRQGEDLNNAEVIASNLETLITIQGALDRPVSNIIFKNISFQHSNWLRPSQSGLVPHQDGMFMIDAYKLKPEGTAFNRSLENQAWVGRPSAAIAVNYAENIAFENCELKHIASTGIDFNKGVHQSIIKGNLLQDIGGNAILCGIYSDESSEIHLPYLPKDIREVTGNISISNNFITDAANEDWGCVGIGAGYVYNTIIEHNELCNLAYSGISVGWGWTPQENVMHHNFITANKIHHYGKHNYDCAGIYTLSAQPNSVISENYIDSVYKAPYAHLPSHWFYLYTDEGSSKITVKNNWTPSQKYLQNANGPDNVWINNGPQVNEKIKVNAGLQSSFQYLLKNKSTGLDKLPINEEHNELIEIISKENKPINIAELRKVLKCFSMDTTAVYQWKNHTVIFDRVQDLSVFPHKVQNAFPEAEVKVYYDLFYQFKRKNCCQEKTVVQNVTHILLTENLVADKNKQREYLNYHATQFDKWPEVAKGFCNANFQQLLMFRKGRQLMLVIDIPKGKTLDELNPKTTENNPRVNEWNSIMKKYQEGIEGTKPAETWVLLNQL